MKYKIKYQDYNINEIEVEADSVKEARENAEAKYFGHATPKDKGKIKEFSMFEVLSTNKVK